MDYQIPFFIFTLIIFGIVTFLSILVMSKTRNSSWMMIVAGFLFSYVSILYNFMVKLRIFPQLNIYLFGTPLISYLSILIPSLCFILAFILKLTKK